MECESFSEDCAEANTLSGGDAEECLDELEDCVEALSDSATGEQQFACDWELDSCVWNILDDYLPDACLSGWCD